MNTVSLCMICKNEISNIGNLLDIVCPVLEEVVVVDTGSTDGTLEVLQEKQKTYPNLIIDHFEWVKDFSKARNYSFSKATQDWVFFLDCDDLVDQQDLIKFKNNELKDTNVDCWILDYVYARLPDGSPYVVLGRERFVRRSSNPTWYGAIHETIGIFHLRQGNSRNLKIVHNQKGKVIDHNRNVEILASEYEKNPNEPRTAYYYGKELFDRVDPKGIEVLKHYLTLEGKYWDDAVNAQFRLACDDLVNNRLNEAFQRANEIFILDSSRERAEYYWMIGSIEQKVGNYKSAIRWYKTCLELNPESPRVVNKEYYTWNPLSKISECYLAIGDVEGAMEYFDKLVTLVGINNCTYLQEKISSYFKPSAISGLIVFDFMGVREDAYNLKYLSPNLKLLLDGFVSEYYTEDFAKYIKPKGFYWYRFGKPKSCQTISSELVKSIKEHEQYEVFNSIKVLPNQNVSYLIDDGDLDFGPYRIRMRNLRNSLIKNGFLVNQSSTKEIRISQNLNFHSERVPTANILDICEWLPHSDYSEYGIGLANLIICSSPLLAELMKRKFPDLKVSCVEDHVDFIDREWL